MERGTGTALRAALKTLLGGVVSLAQACDRSPAADQPDAQAGADAAPAPSARSSGRGSGPLAASSSAAAPPGAAPPSAAISLQVKARPLPGGAGAATLDGIACERDGSRLWVPAGDRGAVDVLSIATDTFTQVEGFATATRPNSSGIMRVVGPSSVALAEGWAYIGNRADQSVCAVNASTLKLGACTKLSTQPDSLAYVAAAKELWVTTPRANSVTILDASHPSRLAQKGTMPLEGASEGNAVDEARGLFYTNVADRDRTLSIDVRTRRVLATWTPRCGEDGPRGLAFDPRRRLLIVACTDHLVTLDAGHDGAVLNRLDTGTGLDHIDFLPRTSRVYAAASKLETLVVAELGADGGLWAVATGKTAPGARSVAAAPGGTAYVADGVNGRILVLSFP